MFSKVRNFYLEVRSELQKASWPWDPNEKGFKKYKELSDSTIVVVIAMLLIGGYIAIFNSFLVIVIGFLTTPKI
ncbi:MAG: preprotein translocase subunit SecE [Chthoniobacterales bacterium]